MKYGISSESSEGVAPHHSRRLNQRRRSDRQKNRGRIRLHPVLLISKGIFGRGRRHGSLRLGWSTGASTSQLQLATKGENLVHQKIVKWLDMLHLIACLQRIDDFADWLQVFVP
jgi:hypothetical protein